MRSGGQCAWEEEEEKEERMSQVGGREGWAAVGRAAGSPAEPEGTS